MVDFEANLVRDLGVKIQFERSLSTKDLSVKDLVDEWDAVFIAIGLPNPKVSPNNFDMTYHYSFVRNSDKTLGGPNLFEPG